MSKLPRINPLLWLTASDIRIALGVAEYFFEEAIALLKKSFLID